MEKILNRPMLTRNQNKMVEILSLLTRQPDTTDMPELENEESAAQRRN